MRMDLLKLLLVDDEAIILKGLAETYDWEQMGYQVVGTADSGEAALALIEDEEPDLVITDIRMKKVSGLELIERTKCSHPEIKFVVVSAYRDFEYARQACQNGALSYLVKPIDDEELEKIMKEAYQLCEREKEKNKRYENWKKILVDNQDSFLSQMIERYVKDLINANELNQLAKNLSRDMQVQNYYAAVCADIDIIHKVENQVEFEMKQYALFTSLEKRMKENYEMWKYANTDGSHVYLVNLLQESDISHLKQLVEEIKEECEYRVIVAISNRYAGLGGMKTAYKQVLKLYHIACEVGAGLLSMSKESNIGVDTQYSVDIENDILRSLRQNSQEQLKAAFEKIVYSLPSDERIAKTYLHRLAVQAEVMLDDSYEISDSLKMGFSNFYSMLEQHNLMRIIDILYKLFGMVIEERKTSAPVMAEEYFSDYMNEALEYIHKHLQDEELSITVVAEKVFLNPVYFGRFFKNVMGITFKRYVLNQRMECAKTLILQGKESIAEIANMVGIPNPSYFSQLFKQATGLLPSEYKKEQSI
ncbi:response regulator [Lachnospiraceae bacterium WCA-693-APC-MOT-I]|uniref:Stage 0 sporulation protein A homolog n=2 Tax=Velocimicrobium porci TaxID=2606634 RepID=A0A6L5XXQ5_9FIRM|nr:response regulator [Velocimicrobium porci]